MKRMSVSITLLLLLLFTFSLSSVCLGAAALDIGVTKTVTNPDLTLNILAAPSKLTVTAVSSSEIKLTWQDNNSGGSRFQVERKNARGAFVSVGSTLEGVATFTDSGLSAETTYCYRVKAYTRSTQSAYSNEASAKTNILISIVTENPGLIVPKDLKPLTPPSAPSGLTATTVSATRIDLHWNDNSSNESKFNVERKVQGGSYEPLAEMGPNNTDTADIGLTTGTKYYYRVKAVNLAGDSAYSNEASATPESQGEIIIEYVVGSTEYNVNGVPKTMDVAPQIIEGRVYLPLRYVAEPLGATMNWDAAAQKVTIFFGGNTIELWVNQNAATVNGVQQMIDPNNPNVTPLMDPTGRVMVPVRFVSQGLGCDVAWDMALQKVIVTYPK